ncbi:hypothetical protein HO173_009612 [Letharia columbiana]|uniref:Uncharacterized protein n=1 Tax=Letharia columbiana TaxID=112416 RepID=A0A8H6FPB9_9LECA|nr:uncharacterized protein HO173_009612 [Letharia columbiana]KAF6232229.1 hypothetical protein HO173_009612 [Letharia columbiana]
MVETSRHHALEVVENWSQWMKEKPYFESAQEKWKLRDQDETTMLNLAKALPRLPITTDVLRHQVWGKMQLEISRPKLLGMEDVLTGSNVAIVELQGAELNSLRDQNV